MRVVILARTDQGQAAGECLRMGASDVVSLPIKADVLRMRLQLPPNATQPSTRRDKRALAVLLELTQALASTLELDDILFTLVQRLAEVVLVDRVSLVMAPSHDEGVVVASSDDAEINSLRIDLRKYPEIQHVLTTRKTLTIDDIGTHPMLHAVRKSVPPGEPCSVSLLPIAWEDRALGVLLLRTSGQTPPLGPREIGFCQVLANATAIALRNARMLQALRDETARGSDARKVAEDRAQALEGYVDVVVSAVDGAIAFDRHGRLLFANPAAYELLGYEPGQVPPGQPVTTFVAAEDRQRMNELAAGFTATRYPHDLDVRALHGSGREIILNGSFSALRGRAGATLFSFRDCTEARRTQGELNKTQRFVQSLVDASVDAIVAADMKGKILLFNNGAQHLYGYEPTAAIGKMYVHALYPGDGAREVGRMLRSPEYGGEGRLAPMRAEAIDAGGNIVPISLTAATIYEAGEATATFGIFCDLREQTRMEEALAHAQEKLALTQKQAVLVELAGTAAHELNQPLTSIMGCAELLTRRLPEGEPALKLVHTMLEQAERMAEIVRKIGGLTEYQTKNYVGGQRILDLSPGTADADTGPPSPGDDQDP